jgi:hypothetical protein
MDHCDERPRERSEAGPEARLVTTFSGALDYQLVPDGQFDPDIVRVAAPVAARVIRKLHPDLEWPVTT